MQVIIDADTKLVIADGASGARHHRRREGMAGVRPGRALLPGEEADNAEQRRVRAFCNTLQN